MGEELGLGWSQASRAAAASLAGGFGQQTVAEGVEWCATVNLLRDLGVDYGRALHSAGPRRRSRPRGGTTGDAAIAHTGSRTSAQNGSPCVTKLVAELGHVASIGSTELAATGELTADESNPDVALLGFGGGDRARALRG